MEKELQSLVSALGRVVYEIIELSESDDSWSAVYRALEDARDALGNTPDHREAR